MLTCSSNPTVETWLEYGFVKCTKEQAEASIANNVAKYLEHYGTTLTPCPKCGSQSSNGDICLSCYIFEDQLSEMKERARRDYEEAQEEENP